MWFIYFYVAWFIENISIILIDRTVFEVIHIDCINNLVDFLFLEKLKFYCTYCINL